MTKLEALKELTELDILRKTIKKEQDRVERLKAKMYSVQAVNTDGIRVQTSQTKSKLEDDIINFISAKNNLIDIVLQYRNLQSQVEKNIKNISYTSRDYIMSAYVFGIPYTSDDKQVSKKTVSEKALKEYTALRTAQGD